MSFPRYPTYKPSGVEWLGEVPEHWEVLPLKRRSRLLTEKTDCKDNPIALENIEGWTGRLVETESEFQGEGVAFQAGDILFGKLRPYLAKVYLAENSGQAIGDFHIISPFDRLRPRFLQLQLLTREIIDLVNGSTYGAKMPRASWDFLGSLHLSLPPVDEQHAIATFLDHETAKTDALIAEQQRLIELLQEKRQAVISHAVTKGLNPDAPMKDSGVEWLGEVPEHWEVGALSYALSAVGDVDHYMPETVQEGVPYVMTGDLNDLASQIDFEGCKQVADQDYKRLSRKIKTATGDLIMARYATIGTVAYVDVDREFLVSYSCVTIKPDAAKADGMYLFFCLKSDSFFKGIQQRVNTNTQENIGIGDLKKVKVALPQLNEQLEIVKHLQAQVSEMDGIIKASKVTVGLLKERRSALISAAVTGQIDVRGLVPEAEAV